MSGGWNLVCWVRSHCRPALKEAWFWGGFYFLHMFSLWSFPFVIGFAIPARVSRLLSKTTLAYYSLPAGKRAGEPLLFKIHWWETHRRLSDRFSAFSNDVLILVQIGLQWKFRDSGYLDKLHKFLILAIAAYLRITALQRDSERMTPDWRN